MYNPTCKVTKPLTRGCLPDFLSSSNLLNAFPKAVTYQLIRERSLILCKSLLRPVLQEVREGGSGAQDTLSTPIIHAPLSAHSTPFCLVSDSCTLDTPSWLPVRLAGEAPALKTAWFGYMLHHGSGPWTMAMAMLCTLLPTETEQSQSPLGCSIYCHLGWKHSRVWKGREPDLEGRYDVNSKTTLAHKYWEVVRRGSELRLQ